MTNRFESVIESIRAGLRQLGHRRLTLRYPEKKLELPSYYTYDPKLAVAKPGYKGRHILWLDKCTGCQLCSIACENIAQAIEMVKVGRKQPNNRKSIFPQVDYGKCVFCGLCIDPETPVLTNPDVKAISEISVGDKVLTHNGEYKRVTKVWDMKYSGPMYKIFVYGKPEPLVCTADHRVLAVQRHVSMKEGRLPRLLTQPLAFHKPTELKIGDYLVGPIPKREIPLEKYVQEISLSKHGKAKKVQELEASGSLFRLVGYYLAEGCCQQGRVVRFSFHSGPSSNNLVRDCVNLLKHFFGKPAFIEKNGRKGVDVVICFAESVKFFEQFGENPESRRLPEWVFFAEKQKQIQLIKGYWLGGRSRTIRDRRRYLRFRTTSPVLAFQVQQVLSRLGIVATLKKVLDKEKTTSYYIDAFGRWAIKLAELIHIDHNHVRLKNSDKFLLSNEFVYMPIRKIEVKKVQDHRVMDVTVDDDHTFTPLGLATSNCVDACPFYALGMTDDYNLVAYEKKDLVYSPERLAIPPKRKEGLVQLRLEPEVAYHE
jgi:formate hydrogenlyase subunit 6/NADH:ubiquinone oxidoreductase subunit I/intein/homing endonuclease